MITKDDIELEYLIYFQKYFKTDERFLLSGSKDANIHINRDD